MSDELNDGSGLYAVRMREAIGWNCQAAVGFPDETVACGERASVVVYRVSMPGESFGLCAMHLDIWKRNGAIK